MDLETGQVAVEQRQGTSARRAPGADFDFGLVAYLTQLVGQRP